MNYNKKTDIEVGDSVRVVNEESESFGDKGYVIMVDHSMPYEIEIRAEEDGAPYLFTSDELEIIHDAAYLKAKQDEEDLEECMSEADERLQIAYKLLDIMEKIMEYEAGSLVGLRKVDAESALNELRKECAEL